MIRVKVEKMFLFLTDTKRGVKNWMTECYSEFDFVHVEFHMMTKNIKVIISYCQCKKLLITMFQTVLNAIYILSFSLTTTHHSVT